MPALRSRHLSLLPLLKSGEQGIARSHNRLTNGLVVVQLAFAVLLLTCATLAYRSTSLVDTVDLRFDTRNVIRLGRSRTEVEVIGVAPDAFFSGFHRNDRPRYVLSSGAHEPSSPGDATFYIRHTSALDSVAPAIRHGLLDLEPRAPIVSSCCCRRRRCSRAPFPRGGPPLPI